MFVLLLLLLLDVFGFLSLSSMVMSFFSVSSSTFASSFLVDLFFLNVNFVVFFVVWLILMKKLFLFCVVDLNSVCILFYSLTMFCSVLMEATESSTDIVRVFVLLILDDFGMCMRSILGVGVIVMYCVIVEDFLCLLVLFKSLMYVRAIRTTVKYNLIRFGLLCLLLFLFISDSVLVR